MIRPYIPKQCPGIPDSYGIKVHYHSGDIDSFQGLHSLIRDTQSLEIVTKDNEWTLIPMTSIKKVIFDKNFPKYLEAKKEAQIKKVSDGKTS